MRFNLLSVALGALPFVSAHTSALIVTQVPDHVRPYIVRACSIDVLVVGPQVHRFPVTGESSGAKFTLISTAAPASSDLGVLPHQHYLHYENFFCLRESFQWWAEKEDISEARLLTVGDYGAVPQNTTHTFQLLSPVNGNGRSNSARRIRLFYALATSNYTSYFDSPFPPISNTSSAGSDSSIISALQDFDVWAQLDFVPRRDLLNGSAPASDWHAGPNALAADSGTRFFVANGHGPQYMTNSTGLWHIISPFITSLQSDGNFTQGTITLSKRFNATYVPQAQVVDTHTAFEVTQGQLTIAMKGEVLQLVIGDVAFISAGTSFPYWSDVAYKTVMYIGGGSDTLDNKLMGASVPWSGANFPDTTSLT